MQSVDQIWKYNTLSGTYVDSTTNVVEDLVIIYPTADTPADRPSSGDSCGECDLSCQEAFAARMKMFDVAFKTSEISTISVQPKNPNLFQMWYQKRVTENKPEEYRHHSSIFKIAQMVAKESEINGKIPPMQKGFLKPFDAFSSAQYRADPIFDGVKVAIVKDFPNLSPILSLFLEDKEAVSLGLVHNGNPLLFHKDQ